MRLVRKLCEPMPPWSRVALALLVVLTALPALTVRQVSNYTNVQPLLTQMAAQHPDSRLNVIVQTMGTANNVSGAVPGLGGLVTKDLHIINAFAADLPARSVDDLAALPGVRWISLDAPVVRTGTTPAGGIDLSNLANAYDRAIGADRVWNEGPSYYQGQSIGVAVVDSGVNTHRDLNGLDGDTRIVASAQFNGGSNQTVNDAYGHGTHVAGIIGGNGARSDGTYIGVAPNVNIINVKVSDDQGAATASSVVAGLQWINENRTRYNIRVVNISLNSSTPSSYHEDPLDAAVEILWFNSIVVVVSAGNNGQTGALYSPANDPFAITVGATDDRGTATISDDVLASFSAYGTTGEGFAKPDLVAPGTNIVSLKAANNTTISRAHPDNTVYYYGGVSYFRMSGTSMSAPMVAGAAALLLQSNPGLTPDQVKYRLKSTARPFDTTQRAGAGYLDVYAAVHSTTTGSANTGINASQLLWSGSQPVTWGSVNWNSVNWNSVNWNSVNWNSVNWNSVNWNSDYWAP